MPSFMLMLVLLANLSCSKQKEEALDLSAMSSASLAPAPPPEKKEEPPRYFYPYAQKRDPFTPLVGEYAKAMASRERSGGMEQGDVANLELKGILRDKKGKIALIASTDGEPYTLRSGRIYDKKNRLISGVSGIIKESSVVLITQNRTVKELPLYRTGSAGSAATGGQ